MASKNLENTKLCLSCKTLTNQDSRSSHGEHRCQVVDKNIFRLQLQSLFAKDQSPINGSIQLYQYILSSLRAVQQIKSHCEQFWPWVKVGHKVVSTTLGPQADGISDEDLMKILEVTELGEHSLDISIRDSSCKSGCNEMISNLKILKKQFHQKFDPRITQHLQARPALSVNPTRGEEQTGRKENHGPSQNQRESANYSTNSQKTNILNATASNNKVTSPAPGSKSSCHDAGSSVLSENINICNKIRRTNDNACRRVIPDLPSPVRKLEQEKRFEGEIDKDE